MTATEGPGASEAATPVLRRDLGQVAALASGSLLVVFVAVNAALLKLRFDDPGTREGSLPR